MATTTTNYEYSVKLNKGKTYALARYNKTFTNDVDTSDIIIDGDDEVVWTTGLKAYLDSLTYKDGDGNPQSLFTVTQGDVTSTTTNE